MVLEQLAQILQAMRSVGAHREQAFLAVVKVARGSGRPPAEIAEWLRAQREAWPSEAAAAAEVLRGDVGAWRPVFLAILREKGLISLACELAGATRSWAYELRDQDAGFRAAWDASLLAWRRDHAPQPRSAAVT